MNQPSKIVEVNGKPYKVPSIRTMQHWVFDGVAKTPDGCRVEPDGRCQHGFDSWLIILGFC